MWNSSVTKCKICTWEFEDERPDRGPEYRKHILQMCSTHLFDELVVCSDINCNEPLPFCPYCLENIDKISSMNDGCNLIRKEVENVANRFIMDSLRNRKLIKSKREIFLDTKPIIKSESQTITKHNCVICYAVYMTEYSAQKKLSMENKSNIWKVCKKYGMLPAFLKNECNFEWKTLPLLNIAPFCSKCSLRVKGVIQLDEKLDHAMIEIGNFVDSFSLDCFKRQKCQNDKIIEENNKNIECVTLDDDSDIETVFSDCQEVTQRCEDTTSACSDDPLELNPISLNDYENGTSNLVPIGVSKIAIHGDLDSNSPETNATANSEISDSQATQTCPSENTDSFSPETSDHQDSENGRSFSTEEGNKDSVIVTENPPLSNYSPNTSVRLQRLPIRTCSDCKVVYKYSHRCNLTSNQSMNKKANTVKCVSFSANIVSSVQHSNNTADKEANRKCTHQSKRKSRAELGTEKLDLIQNQQSKRRSSLRNTRSTNRTILPIKEKPTRKVTIYKCTYCFAQFGTTKELTDHYQTHYHEATESTCTLCQYVYATPQRLYQHLKKKHGSKSRKIKLNYRNSRTHRRSQDLVSGLV